MEGKLFTVIVGSAYRDGTEHTYLVDAFDAQAACEYAERIATAHDSTKRCALYCFEGEVKFCPTLFTGEWKDKPYVQDVIDLRMPKVPLERIEKALPSTTRWNGQITLHNQSLANAKRLVSALKNSDYEPFPPVCMAREGGVILIDFIVPKDVTPLRSEIVIRRKTAVVLKLGAEEASNRVVTVQFTERK